MKGRVIGGGGLISRTVLTMFSTNYIVHPSARWLYVKVWGGGGDAPTVTNTYNSASGAFCKVIVPVIPNETLNIQILPGGSRGNSTQGRYGGNGGNGYGLFRASSPLVIAGGGGGGIVVGSIGGSNDGARRGGFPAGFPLLMGVDPNSGLPIIGASGTQSAGGQGGVAAQPGGYLFGGNGAPHSANDGGGSGGGGGGGYFGGGGGASTETNPNGRSGQGGGGSSFSANNNENIFMSNGQHEGRRSTPPPEALSDVDYAFNASQGAAWVLGSLDIPNPIPAGGVLMVIYAYRNKPDYSNLP